MGRLAGAEETPAPSPLIVLRTVQVSVRVKVESLAEDLPTFAYLPFPTYLPTNLPNGHLGRALSLQGTDLFRAPPRCRARGTARVPLPLSPLHPCLPTPGCGHPGWQAQGRGEGGGHTQKEHNSLLPGRHRA